MGLCSSLRTSQLRSIVEYSESWRMEKAEEGRQKSIPGKIASYGSGRGQSGGGGGREK